MVNYRDLLYYGFYDETGSYIVVLDKYKLKDKKVNLDQEYNDIKAFFEANTIEVE